MAISAEDDVFTRSRWINDFGGLLRPLVSGDLVRDWLAIPSEEALFPYDEDGLLESDAAKRALWPYRTGLWARETFGRKTYREDGRAWWSWHQTTIDRLRTALTMTWGEVATHNHFVLDRGGKVFKQTAPVIKLPASATADDHLRLLGVLNSSTACFWLKQVCQPKGGDHVGKEGARVSKSPWEDRYALNASNVRDLPLPEDRPLRIAKRLDALANERAGLLDDLPEADLGAHVRSLAERDAQLLAEMIALQEELDWQVLKSFGLVKDDAGPVEDPPPLALGERAFEIVLARQVAAGEAEPAWFDRHGSTPITDLPAAWPACYRERVERRIALIGDDPDVGLIERPEHKRRWSGQPPFTERLAQRLRSLVLDRLEAPDLWSEPRLRSIDELADTVRREPQLAEACTLLTADPDADIGDTVKTLVLDDAVPHLAALRHTASGMRKRASWERTWELQRAEDRGEVVGAIPVPPRYGTGDFRSTTTWRLRGKLDVPKERFMLVPGAERGAGAAALAWAGWDEATRANAIAARVIELQGTEAPDAERLIPMLAGVLELLPWVHQWHDQDDASLGTFLEEWLDGTLPALGLTREDLFEWRPLAPTRGRRRQPA